MEVIIEWTLVVFFFLCAIAFAVCIGCIIHDEVKKQDRFYNRRTPKHKKK